MLEGLPEISRSHLWAPRSQASAKGWAGTSERTGSPGAQEGSACASPGKDRGPGKDRCAPRSPRFLLSHRGLTSRPDAGFSPSDPNTVSFPAPSPRTSPLPPPPPAPSPGGGGPPFRRRKGLISPAGKNWSAESLTGDRWATFFGPQRGRNEALRGIQMGRSRGSRLLAGLEGPYGACRGGWRRGGGRVAGDGSRRRRRVGEVQGCRGGEVGREGGGGKERAARAHARAARAPGPAGAPLPAPPALGITTSAI